MRKRASHQIRRSTRSANETPTEKLYTVVRAIPRGRVATYGEIAALAGITAGHRIAARAMKNCPDALPWQRVLGKKDARRGQINIEVPEHAALQRALLEAEGIRFDANGFIPLRQYGWLSEPDQAPRIEPEPRTPRRAARPSSKKPASKKKVLEQAASKASRSAKRRPG